MAAAVAAMASAPASADSQACKACSGTSCSRNPSCSQRAIRSAHCAAAVGLGQAREDGEFDLHESRCPQPGTVAAAGYFSTKARSMT
jgi:hypothetical protein